MKARVETREQSRNSSLNDIVQYMYNYALLELVQGRFRHWYRSKHTVSIFSGVQDSPDFLWALVVQLLLWVLVTRPVPVMPQERDFPGFRESLGYRLGREDLARDRWCYRICSMIPKTLNDKSVPLFDSGAVQHYLAYGSCARSTSGSQNLAVLPKRHDNSLSLRN